VCVCVCVYVCVGVCMYACMYVCMIQKFQQVCTFLGVEIYMYAGYVHYLYVLLYMYVFTFLLIN